MKLLLLFLVEVGSAHEFALIELTFKPVPCSELVEVQTALAMHLVIFESTLVPRAIFDLFALWTHHRLEGRIFLTLTFSLSLIPISLIRVSVRESDGSFSMHGALTE